MRLLTYGHIGHAPFVRFFLALATGIGIGHGVGPQWWLYALAWGLLAVVVAVFMTIRSLVGLRDYRYYGVLGLLVLIAWCIVGCLLTWRPNPAINHTHFSRFNSQALIGVIADEPVVRGSHIRFPLEVTQVYGEDGIRSTSGKLMVAVRVDDSLESEPLVYGDELVIPSGFEMVPPPFNPGEFDYQAYLANKRLWHQDYLAAGEFKKLAAGKGNPFIAHALDFRRRMVAKFAAYIADHDAYSVASALILGYRAEMNESLVQAFSNTGTIHVLSVSGMHVVLVFWLLAKLLWWMNRGKGLRAAKFIILLGAVWGYAALTGFSPPVLRASMMVSFVMAADIFGHQNRIYNSIAASAFFLLLYDPGFINDIGFQLSYLAVLGIVFLQPVMRLLIPAGNRVLRPVTDYMGMSIGAQAGAGPLAAYYFHQFPLYFLPANLLIVLPTSAIMYVGFALLVLPAGQLALWTGMLLEKLILFTNTLLAQIEQWPMASIRGIWISWWEWLLFYGVVVAIAFAIVARHRQWMYAAVGCATVIVCSSFLGRVTQDDRQVIVFNVRRNLAIGFIDRDRAWLYTNLPSLDDRTVGYSVRPALEAYVPEYRIRFMAQDSVYRDQLVYTKGGILQFDHARIMVYDGTTRYTGRLSVDAVVVRNNPDGSLNELLASVDCRQLILDGSNDDATIARWKAEADTLSIPVYVLKNNFAYVWSLESSVMP